MFMNQNFQIITAKSNSIKAERLNYNWYLRTWEEKQETVGTESHVLQKVAQKLKEEQKKVLLYGTKSACKKVLAAEIELASTEMGILLFTTYIGEAVKKNILLRQVYKKKMR